VNDRKSDPKSPALGETLWRELSARTILLHQAVADRLGISTTEHKCLDIAERAGRPLTAGELAEMTGLSTGAITGVLDRLEEAGFVRREKDPHDRRIIHIRLLPQRMREIERLFAPIGRATAELAARYDARDLALVTGFLEECGNIVQRETEKLRAEMGPSRPPVRLDGPEQSVPLGALRSGTLEFRRGVFGITIGSVAEPLLYRARFAGAVPRVEVSGGTVTLWSASSSFKLFGKRQNTEIDLQRAIPWLILVRGGASKVTAKLGDLELGAVDIRGGVSQIVLSLPKPRGTVPVTIRGGVDQLRITRPHGVAVRLLVGRGVSDLVIDTLRLGAVGGEMRWESPDFVAATDRYEIEIAGGASGLVLVAA